LLPLNDPKFAAKHLDRPKVRRDKSEDDGEQND
jgi:hypothetical protein